MIRLLVRTEKKNRIDLRGGKEHSIAKNREQGLTYDDNGEAFSFKLLDSYGRLSSS